MNVVATTAKGCSAKSSDYVASVVATEGLWTGAVDSDWNNPNNWCSNSIPVTGNIEVPKDMGNGPEIQGDITVRQMKIGSGSEVTLNPGASLTINNSLTNNGLFVLQSTTDAVCSLNVPDGNTDSGQGRIELSGLQSKHWMRLGQPIANPRAGIYNVGDLVNSWIYKTEHQWVRLTDPNQTLNPLEGVAVWYESAPATLTYTGTLNSGEVTHSFDYGTGYVLMSNPFPSAIDWKKGDGAGWSRSANVSPTIWHRIYIGGGVDDYEFAYNRTTGIPQVIPTEYGFTAGNVSQIAPLQSVWIKLEGTGATTLKVNNKARVNNSLPLKSSTQSSGSSYDLLRIRSFKANGLADGTVIYFDESFLPGKDPSDSPKKFNSSKALPEIYTRVNGASMAINGLPALKEAQYAIPVSVRNRVEGTVTLSFNLDEFNNQEYDLHLEDKVTGNWTDLREVADYAYTPTHMGDEHNRFVLHLDRVQKVTTSVETPDNSETPGIFIIGQDDYALVKISQELLNGNDATIEVLDMNGRLTKSIDTRSTETSVKLPGNTGVYVVKVIARGVRKTKKIIRRNDG